MQQIVQADARRWYLHILSSAPPGTGGIFPQPVPAGAAASPPAANEVEIHFRDAPGLCVSAWSGLGAPAVVYHVWEQLYTGG